MTGGVRVDLVALARELREVASACDDVLAADGMPGGVLEYPAGTLTARLAVLLDAVAP